MHIKGFVVSGDVLGPRELISFRTRFVVSDLRSAPNSNLRTVEISEDGIGAMDGSNDGFWRNRESECHVEERTV
jgi:hypothetical protein